MAALSRGCKRSMCSLFDSLSDSESSSTKLAKKNETKLKTKVRKVKRAFVLKYLRIYRKFK